MEPLVTLESSRLTRVTGNIRYLLGLVRALAKLRAWNMEMEWEGGHLSGPTYLLSVCNGRRVGKLFLMAPRARFDDGLLDVVYAPRLTWPRLFQFLWQLLRGKHLLHPDVRHFQTPWIRLRSDPGTPIHADGEMLGEDWTNIDIRLQPGQLTVFTT